MGIERRREMFCHQQERIARKRPGCVVINKDRWGGGGSYKNDRRMTAILNVDSYHRMFDMAEKNIFTQPDNTALQSQKAVTVHL